MFGVSRQKNMQFFTKIDISACEIWLKVKFGPFEIIENPSF